MPDPNNPFGVSAGELYDLIFYWQGECFNVSYDEEQPCWVVTVSAPFGVMVHRVVDNQPDAATLWDVLQEALQIPQIGDFRRPTVLKAKPNQGWEQLEPQLQDRGIALETCADLELIDGVGEILDSAYVAWDKRRTKWKVLRQRRHRHCGNRSQPKRCRAELGGQERRQGAADSLDRAGTSGRPKRIASCRCKAKEKMVSAHFMSEV
jgi:hypothetical protein